MVDSVVVPGRLPNAFSQVISKNNLETSFNLRLEIELIALRAGFIPCCISLFPGDKQGSVGQA